MFLLAAGVHTGIPLPNDRASRDGFPDVAPGPRAGAPFTQGRIPVRPQRRVRYAIGNNKSFGRVVVTLDRRAPIIAPPAQPGLYRSGQSPQGLSQGIAKVPDGANRSDQIRVLQRAARTSWHGELDDRAAVYPVGRPADRNARGRVSCDIRS